MKPVLSEAVAIDTPYGNIDTYVGRYGDRDGAFLVGFRRGKHRKAPLVRAQYGCAHGTVFKSRSCDCGSQIESSLTMLGKSNGPALFVYFKDHEAYGLGIFEKMALLRAEQKQGKSYAQLVAEDKFRAPDDSVLAVLPHILKSLKLPLEIVLLTSNLAKRTAIEAEGVQVLDCVPLGSGDVPELQRRAGG
jgi:GTP cyclohydrolase II